MSVGRSVDPIIILCSYENLILLYLLEFIESLVCRVYKTVIVLPQYVRYFLAK